MFPVLHSWTKPSDLMDGSWQSWASGKSPRDFTGLAPLGGLLVALMGDEFGALQLQAIVG